MLIEDKFNKFRGLFFAIAFLMVGCANFEYHDTVAVPPSKLDSQANQLLTEQELLDVGIVVFDPGMDNLDDDAVVFANVRRSEAVWFATQLKSTIQNSNIWGSIRSMPSANSIVDVLVTGKILGSNGEKVELLVTVKDATGAIWFSKEYEKQASAYAYNPEVNYNKDPFHGLFVNIANDLFDYRLSLSKPQALAVRSIAKMRFADEFVPEVFDGFLNEKDGEFSLLRVPAENDPMMLRVERIRSRNDLFLDVIQDYYRVFNNNMAAPYQEWRKASYREVIYARQLKEQARKEKIAGTAAILAGVLAQTSDSRNTRGAGHVGIFSGANLIYKGYQKQNDALLHSATVNELSAALENELAPSVIDLEDRSVTLSGTVDEQFNEWRRILGEMFKAENGSLSEYDNVSSPEINAEQTPDSAVVENN